MFLEAHHGCQAAEQQGKMRLLDDLTPCQEAGRTASSSRACLSRAILAQARAASGEQTTTGSYPRFDQRLKRHGPLFCAPWSDLHFLAGVVATRVP